MKQVVKGILVCVVLGCQSCATISKGNLSDFYHQKNSFIQGRTFAASYDFEIKDFAGNQIKVADTSLVRRKFSSVVEDLEGKVIAQEEAGPNDVRLKVRVIAEERPTCRILFVPANCVLASVIGGGTLTIVPLSIDRKLTVEMIGHEAGGQEWKVVKSAEVTDWIQILLLPVTPFMMPENVIYKLMLGAVKELNESNPNS